MEFLYIVILCYPSRSHITGCFSEANFFRLLWNCGLSSLKYA